jgi:hypothetical protein
MHLSSILETRMTKPPLWATISIVRAHPENEELLAQPMTSAIPLQTHPGSIFRITLNYAVKIWLNWYAKALIF